MQSTKSSSLQSRLWRGAALAALMVAGGAQAATAPAAPAPADAATPSDTDSTNVEQIVITGQRETRSAVAMQSGGHAAKRSESVVHSGAVAATRASR